MLVYCLVYEDNRERVAEGFAKLVLALVGAFGMFTLIMVSELAEKMKLREERLRERRERQAEEEDMYWREVDPRGRFRVMTRMSQKAERGERARKRKWVPQTGGSTG